MGLKKRALDLVARIGNLHPHSFAYLDVAEKMGLPSEINIPKELIPAASLLIARAWANTAVFEVSQGLPRPYWVEKQYDPSSAYFEPIGHRLLSMNTTLRNWSMVGIPGYSTEGIIDPVGAITPKRDGFSIEIWAEKDGTFYLPHKQGRVFQTRDHENYPAIRTTWTFEGGEISWVVFAEGDSIGEWIAVDVYDQLEEGFKTVMAIRPYNYDGIALINKIRVEKEIIELDPSGLIHLTSSPTHYFLGEYPFEDPADPSLSPTPLKGNYELKARNGLATCILVFNGGAIGARIFVEGKEALIPPEGSWDSYWREVLPTLPKLVVKDMNIGDVFKATAVDLLMVWDGNSITPGPGTYHHFWIRDNAYILPALLHLGRYQEVESVLRSYPKRQKRNGYFVSQKGEWDANGQAIYTMAQYFRHSKDIDFVEAMKKSIWKAAQWIEKKRNSWNPDLPEYEGLLPPGFSAEHFGGTDSYYWDQFWGIKGLEEATFLLAAINEDEKAELCLQWSVEFRKAVEKSIEAVIDRLGSHAIPASPRRGYDSGMIGSVVAFYPTEVFSGEDKRVKETVHKLREVSWFNNLFYQQNGHMALGTYLSLHVAHSYLWMNNPVSAKPIFDKLLELATPTFTWPEGINPRTEGGGMGDGNHMWMAADMNWFIRDMIVHERSNSWYFLFGLIDPSEKEIKARFLPFPSGIIKELSVKDGVLRVSASDLPQRIFIRSKEGEVLAIEPESLDFEVRL